MSSDVEPRSSLLENILAGRLSNRLIAALVVVVVLLIGTPIALLLFRSSPLPVTGPKPLGTEDGLMQVRDNLAKETDLITLKNAVQQLNSHFNQLPPEKRPPRLEADQRQRLEHELGLTSDELAEIDSSTFTVLDAHHLELCFLLRDAAEAIQADVAIAAADDPAIRLTPLDQATAAFNWVVRQVRLEVTGTMPIPPEFILRRGQGTALERSLVFLELLRQFNLENETASPMTGCLVVDPGTSAADQRLWAVGVVIDKEIYLFDPRLGLPIPGPEGKGVATLAQVLKDDKILGQLTVDKKYPYDVTAEQARSSEANLYAPLSALAPRVAYLQKSILAPRIHVNLATDVFADEAAVQTALQAAGAKTAPVRVHAEGVRLLRAFLPVEEGGADIKPVAMALRFLPGFANQEEMAVVQMWRKRYFEFNLVPWWGLPDPFRDIPFNSSLGSFVRDQYAQPFRQSALEPQGVRDLMLHGHYTEAISKLMDERETLTSDYRQWQKVLQAAANERAVNERVYKWLDEQASPAAAKMERAKREGSTEEYQEAARNMMKVWEAGPDVKVFLAGSIAAKRRPEVTFLLALALHEQAERLQVRVDTVSRRSASGPSKEDVDRAKDAWRKAQDWWRRYSDEFPTGSAVAALRRPRGRCQLMLGDRQAAVATWQDVSDPPPSAREQYPRLPTLEKVGNVYLAKQLQKQHEPGGKP